MASLVLSTVGQAVGASIGGTVLGISAAQLGGMAGAVAGSYLDGILFPTQIKGSRLSDLSLQTSTEGAAIPRIDGNIRVAGQLIWATKYTESESTSGGKGAGTSTTSYTYTISFAVGLGQGVVASLGRIWADGSLLDASQYTIRFYTGSETQVADTLIEEIEGTGNSPAYRGLAYVVFEDMDVTDFGGRIPQLQFELVRSITAQMHDDALENLVACVNIIPGAGEFVYATTVVVRDYGDGTTVPENQANASGEADAVLSLDDLAAVCPNLKAVNLVVGWFGSDLRCCECVIKPKVDLVDKDTYGTYTDDDGDTEKTDYSWSVDDLSRSEAAAVSYVDGYPAYGGTPSDRSVKQLIKAIKAKGWAITFYPFVFMDIPSSNTLSNPYSDNAATSGQAAFPWRGRITCSPAPAYAGTVNLTSAAATQIDSFFTRSWGYNRFITHYANLCVAAGGVDGFLLGSELKGLTRVRSASTTYPAVTALKTLAATVKSIVGADCQVGYGANWDEWNNHQTGDVSGAVQFNLDPLWADDNIDFIGIDNYMPLSDWRDGTTHLDYDAANGPISVRDIDYLQSNIAGGEDYDWYYASDADRDSQTRTAIADATYAKPWVWRAKDLKNWWSNAHYDRVDGSESSAATAWVPQSKPFRFVELGCPAIDKGANQPNVFVDAKSSESATPYYSTGMRDDLMQRAFLEAQLRYWADSDNNPTSTVYASAMVSGDDISLWSWDARPFPFFPGRSDLWADAANYDLGHWLNGRLGSVMLADLVTEICTESGFTEYDVSDLEGLVTGYARTSTLSARDELESLAKAFFFDGVETQGKIAFLMRGRSSATAISEDELVIDPDSDTNYSFSLTRAQDDDLPKAYRITYLDASNGYEQGSYQAKRLVGNSNRVTETALPLVMDRAQAGGIGDRLIQETWISRETAAFGLPPSFLALDPTDEVKITVGGRIRRLRLTEITECESRALSAVATDPTIYESLTGAARDTASTVTAKQTGRALLAFMDLPLLDADEDAYAPHLASYADPWPGSVLLYRSASDADYTLDTTLATAAYLGETVGDFYSGPVSRWDLVNSLTVKLYSGTCASADETSVLNGANVLALQNGDEWEIVQFTTATLTDTLTWTLTGLLRGLLGSEQNMASPLSAGARVVVVNDRVVQSSLPSAQYATSFNYKWGPSGKAISDASWQSATETFVGVGLRPYAPCHVAYVWEVSGDLTLTWIRRDRDPSSDSWDQSEIPQSEASEAYEIDIKNDSGTVLRTVTGLTVTSWLYSVANQATDFGAALGQGDRLTVSVYQVSAVFGRGLPATVTLYL
jgi:hypothetical protein